MACILAELYTGEMFFSTHENIEHLALMEKICGAFPRHMIESSKNYKDYFDLSLSESKVQERGMRMNWPKSAKSRQNIRNFDEMLSLKDIFYVSICFSHLLASTQQRGTLQVQGSTTIHVPA